MSMSRARRLQTIAPGAAVLVLALCVSGCASQQSDGEHAGAMNAQVAGVAGQRTLLEADGLPVQLTPREMPASKDDPTQPWSPNYGSEPPAQSEPPARTPTYAPWRMGPPTRVANIDEEAVIRRAVADHEMQRQ